MNVVVFQVSTNDAIDEKPRESVEIQLEISEVDSLTKMIGEAEHAEDSEKEKVGLKLKQ